MLNANAQRPALQKDHTFHVLLLIFIVLASGILATGYVYYRNYEKHFRTQAERELSAIGDLKAGELVQWRKERLKDGFILFENPAFTGTVRRFFENPDDTAAREQTGTWLSKIQWHSQYERIRLLDPYGTTRMSVPEGLPPASSMIVQSIAKVFESGLVQFQDFYYNDNDNHIRLALFVPIFDRQNNDRPLGMVVMHIDPEQYLYPLISRWPTPSRTAESLLVRREGDEVLFLNSLRFKPGAAMRLRFSIYKSLELPAVKAVIGYEGIVEGRDYRGVPVLADVRPIPGSPWFIVARMDVAEVYAPLRERLCLVIIIVCTMLIGTGAGLGLIWRQQRACFYRRQYEAETLLQYEKSKSRLYLDLVRVTVVAINADGTVCMINQAGCRLLGYSEQEIIGRNWFESFLPEHSREKVKTIFERLMKGAAKPLELVENTVLTRGNIERIIAWHNTLLHDEQGNITGTLSAGEDITERKQAERDLQRNEFRMQSLVNILQYRTDTVQDFLDHALQEALSLTGSKIGYIYSYDEDAEQFTLNCCSSDVMQQCTIAEKQMTYELDKTGIWGEVVRRRQPVVINDFQGPHPLKRGYPEGHIRLYKFMTVPVFNGNRIVAVVGVANKASDYDQQDVLGMTLLMDSAWKAVESRRVEAELLRLATAVEQAKETVMIMTVDGGIQYVNRAVEQMSGKSREEIIGTNLLVKEQFHEQRMCVWEKIIAGETWTGTITEQNKAGVRYALEITITPVHDEQGAITSIVSIGRDVTREQQLEEQLLHAQKMEALGTLAGGIAHDFNNILGGMMGFVEILKEEVPPDSTALEYLEQVLGLGDRAADLVRQILTFSRKTAGKRKPVQMSLVIKEALKLLRASIPSTIEIRESISEGEGTVTADPTQMHQVLMNLCTNAAHAMQDRGGVLAVGLREISLNREKAKLFENIEPGIYVQLRVSDTGQGISPEIIDRIFDPFFTTKEVGKGTGMGLAVVHGIVRGHGGAVRVESTVGQGTTFSVLLPKLTTETGVDPMQEQRVLSGRERILFVDDEPFLVDTYKHILEGLGYSVTGTTSSSEALALYTADAHCFDIVITDQTMPRMTGCELAQRLRAIRPELPVILCSGFSEAVFEKTAAELGISSFILKPAKAKDIAREIRNIFDAQSDKLLQIPSVHLMKNSIPPDVSL